MSLFYSYATVKSEIHICSNKHDTGLVGIILPNILVTSVFFCCVALRRRLTRISCIVLAPKAFIPDDSELKGKMRSGLFDCIK